MAIFTNIEVDSIIQVDDKIRISAVKTYQSPDETAITSVTIEPEVGAGPIEVFSSNQKNWFLDWEYSTDGTKVIELVITNGGGSQSKTLSVSVLTEADDKLFSSDSDLTSHEADILNYVPAGRNTFKYVHREAQKQILEDIYRLGIVGTGNQKLGKDAIVDIEEVRQWSKFFVLQLIFRDVSTSVGDKFEQLSEMYKMCALESRHKSILKIDLNGDAVLDSTEGIDITWRRLKRV